MSGYNELTEVAASADCGGRLRQPADSLAAKVVTQWKGHRCSDAWRQRIAILVPNCHIRRRGYSEALGFDVVVGVSGVRKGVTAGPTQPVRKCPVVATVGICRV